MKTIIIAAMAMALSGCGRDSEVGRYQFVKDYGKLGAAFDTKTGTMYMYSGVSRDKHGVINDANGEDRSIAAADK